MWLVGAMNNNAITVGKSRYHSLSHGEIVCGNLLSTSIYRNSFGLPVIQEFLASIHTSRLIILISKHAFTGTCPK